MRLFLSLFLIYGLQCIFIGVFILSGEIYDKKRHVFRDLIPFYWVGYILAKLSKLMIESWKELK